MPEIAKFATTQPNSCIILKDGTKLMFTGTQLVLDDAAHIAEVRTNFMSSGYIREIPTDSPEYEDPIERLKRLAVEEHIKKTALENTTVPEKGVGAVEIKAPATPHK